MNDNDKYITNKILHDTMKINVQNMLNQTDEKRTWEAIEHLRNPRLRARFKQVYMELMNQNEGK